jgi:hypothetical protein
LELDLVQALWDECPDAILATSLQATVLRWNGAANIVSGHSFEEAVVSAN